VSLLQGGAVVTGFTCAACGQTVDVGTPLVWRCPGAAEDDRHHVLVPASRLAPLRPEVSDDPFLAYRRYLAVDALADSLGLRAADRKRLIGAAAGAVADAGGVPFVQTPMWRADDLSAALGFSDDGGVWVKDETANVAGSHKARHLFTVLLHLLVVEEVGRAPWADAADRPSLAIASCGNAAIAAATLAAAASWPLEVFVPPTASEAVLALLRSFGARITVCPRRTGDPPGDPCVHRFREAVDNGAIPFSVQGTENGWCLDGGRTIGWEMARVAELDLDGPPFDRLFVQVGGGALAGCVAAGFRGAGLLPKLHAVQTEACAPLARAWELARAGGGVRRAGRCWGQCMWPWETSDGGAPVSAADGILDDETYDWLEVVGGMADGGGSPVVVSEATVLAANELAVRTTGVDVSHTGSAGLAGLLALCATDAIAPDERVAVIFTGIRR
jgi:threonine dehydratase